MHKTYNVGHKNIILVRPQSRKLLKYYKIWAKPSQSKSYNKNGLQANKHLSYKFKLLHIRPRQDSL